MHDENLSEMQGSGNGWDIKVSSARGVGTAFPMSEFFAVDNSNTLTPQQSKVFETAMSPAWSNCSRSYNKTRPSQSRRSTARTLETAEKEKESTRGKLSAKFKKIFA